MRFLLFIIILSIVFFVAGPLAALWVAVATLLLRILSALARLLLKDQPGFGRSFLVLTPVFLAGLIGVLMLDAQVGHVAFFCLLAIVFFGIADAGTRRKRALRVAASGHTSFSPADENEK